MRCASLRVCASLIASCESLAGAGMKQVSCPDGGRPRNSSITRRGRAGRHRWRPDEQSGEPDGCPTRIHDLHDNSISEMRSGGRALCGGATQPIETLEPICWVHMFRAKVRVVSIAHTPCPVYAHPRASAATESRMKTSYGQRKKLRMRSCFFRESVFASSYWPRASSREIIRTARA